MSSRRRRVKRATHLRIPVRNICINCSLLNERARQTRPREELAIEDSVALLCPLVSHLETAVDATSRKHERIRDATNVVRGRSEFCVRRFKTTPRSSSNRRPSSGLESWVNLNSTEIGFLEFSDIFHKTWVPSRAVRFRASTLLINKRIPRPFFLL